MNVELKTAEWKDQIFDVFQDHDIRQVFHVPDAGHSRLIELCQKSNSIRTIALTTEEEGIPLAAGAWLGGQRAAMLMQSSGVGNTVNMLGLTKTLRFPFLTLITMRGDYGEFNSWQYPMGQGTPKVLEAMGVLVYSVDKAEEVRTTVDAAARTAFNGGQSVAVHAVPAPHARFDAERGVAGELVVPVRVAGVARADHLDGELRRAALPGLPAPEPLVRRADADAHVRREAAARVRRVPVDEQVGVDAVRGAEQLAQQVAVQRQGLRAALGGWGVVVVHVRRHVLEQQRPGEGRCHVGLHLGHRHLARADAREQVAQRRQVEPVVQALAVGLEDDRERAVATGDAQEVGGPLPLQPEWGAGTRAAFR